MKKCWKCGKLLCEQNFGRNVNAPDGLDYTCRECRRRYYRSKHPGAKPRNTGEFKTEELVEELNQRGFYIISSDDPLFEDISNYVLSKRLKKANEEKSK